MTAGSGIIHQEMPKGDRDGRMHGFQLWANLPASLKMTKPRYQDVKAVDIPVVNGGSRRSRRCTVVDAYGTNNKLKRRNSPLCSLIIRPFPLSDQVAHRETQPKPSSCRGSF
jgi:redox-sensitive bicupin YhaK (pirin superfamily)